MHWHALCSCSSFSPSHFSKLHKFKMPVIGCDQRRNIHAIPAFIAVKYRGKPNSPFDTHPLTSFLNPHPSSLTFYITPRPFHLLLIYQLLILLVVSALFASSWFFPFPSPWLCLRLCWFGASPPLSAVVNTALCSSLVWSHSNISLSCKARDSNSHINSSIWSTVAELECHSSTMCGLPIRIPCQNRSVCRDPIIMISH